VPSVRPYLYYDHVTTLCEHCLRRVEGKQVIRDGQVWMYKWCPQHGSSKVLIATDAAYWRRAREVYLKPPEMPQRFATEQHWGCPYDCGLCPDHMQHACLSIIEVTEHCNLSCPVCYANSSPQRTLHRSLAEVERMLDAVVASEGEPDVVQISGGEPTLHPEFFAIMDAARRRPIRHLMLNTNGIRIAQESGFAERLAQYAPGFEVYLQFDSFEREALLTLRGADLRRIREQALESLNAVGLSTTLVMTVAAGVNDHEIGRIVEFAAKQRCVRGVTLQPVQFAGRTDQIDPQRARLTLLDQTSLFTPDDVIPVPCNPDALAMAYALKTDQGLAPLTRMIGPEVLVDLGRNTIVFESDKALRDKVFSLFSTDAGPQAQADRLASLLCCLPQAQVPANIGYEQVFRVLIMAFIDAVNFDVRAVKKSCVQIAQPDGRLIPFETFNLLYRDGAADRLAELRNEADAAFGRSGPASATGYRTIKLQPTLPTDDVVLPQGTPV
jgi:7,8-dihydro-6-hydroxymethylpterin dimethyltransferase